MLFVSVLQCSSRGCCDRKHIGTRGVLGSGAPQHRGNRELHTALELATGNIREVSQCLVNAPILDHNQWAVWLIA